MNVIYLLVVSTHLDLRAGMGYKLSSAMWDLCELEQLISLRLRGFFSEKWR